MQNIDIKLKRSKHFIFLLLIALCWSVGVSYTLPIPYFYKALLLCFVMSYGGYIFYRHGLLLHSQSILRIVFQEERWFLGNLTELFPVQLSGHSTVTSWLAVLCFTLPGERGMRATVIMQDSMSNDLYRQLLVSLRLKHSTPSVTVSKSTL